jgi:molecular chaperone DnaK (HSP70)
MDEPERLQRLIDACERAMERLDDNSVAQAEVWLLDDLRALRADLQRRRNEGVIANPC